MNIFVLLYNSGTDKEGIHSIELKGRTIVLMFEEKDDATRYCGLLEAQDFPLPTVEMINIEEIKDFCIKLDYEFKLVEKNFVPKTAEDRLLISPPQKNLEVDTPPFAGDGWRLRLENIARGGKDHYLQLKVQTESGLRIDGLRVLYKLELFPHDALLGCAVEVPTLDGNVTLQVPPKSSTLRPLSV